MRVAGLPHDGLPAVGADVLHQHLRALDVEQDLGARMALEEIAGQERQDEVGLVPPPALVHHAHPVGVPAEGDAEVGPDLAPSRGSRAVRVPSPRSKSPARIVSRSPWISSSVSGAAPAWIILTPLSETGLWLPVTVAPPSSFQWAVAK